MAQLDAQPLLNYYLRSRLYRHAATLCTEVLRKNVGADAEPVLHLWRAVAALLEGQHVEALRDLSPLVNHLETEVAATCAMILAHKGARVVDEDAVSDLQMRLDELERSASERGLMQAAYLYWHTGRYEKAHTLAQRVLRVQKDYPAATVLQGWCELAMDPEDDIDGNDVSNIEDARRRFQQVLAAVQDGGAAVKCELEAALGMAKCYELQRLPKQALKVLNDVQARFPWFEPVLEDQIRVLLSCGDWDGAIEYCDALLQRDSSNIEALRVKALYHLAIDTNSAEATRHVSELLSALDRTEPMAATLYLETARPIARICAGDSSILQLTTAMCERAQKILPHDAAAFTEHANQMLMGSNIKGAMEMFNRASNLDGLDLGAMLGSIRCQALLGMYDDAASSVEMLSSMGSTINASLELALLKATLAYYRDMDANACSDVLDQAVREHINGLVNKPFGYEFFAVLEPHLMLDVARLYLALAPQEPRGANEASSRVLSKCQYCVESTTRVAPGLNSASLLMAKCHFLDAQYEAAISAARAVLQSSPSDTEAHILLSQIYLHLGRIKQAGVELEQALSYNFAVRDSPTFVIANARVLMHDEKYEEAVQCLDMAMKIPGVARPIKDPARHAGDVVGTFDRASIFLLLAEAHMKLKAFPEASKLVHEALEQFSGTPQEVRVIVANCDLSLAKGDTSRALRKLRDIPADSPHYLKARMAMADIYLKHKHDRHAYAQCYEDLVAKYPDVQTLCMLGEALMSIQEPERAVKAFESALKQNPRDRLLASKMGKALVMTHDYQKAVDYYERALMQDKDSADLMALELAELYHRLRRYDRAQQAVNHILEQDGTETDLEGLKNKISALLLMAKMFVTSGRSRDDALRWKMRALEAQEQLISRMLSDSAAELSLQRSKAADLCCEVADECLQTREHTSAQNYYEKALVHLPGHTLATLNLAKLHLANGKADECQQMCVSLLRTEPDNEEASMILAELMAQREHNETAIYHFQQLLQKNPANFSALSQLVQLLRRAGRLDEAERYLRSAETANPRAVHEPGMKFCRGMYARLKNDPHEALRFLNYARKDSEWGNAAVYEMVEVFLRPGTDAIWASDEDVEGVSSSRSQPSVEMSDAIYACNKLLGEVKEPRSQRHRVLKAYTLMASGVKDDVDEAVKQLIDMASNERDSVPVLLALATAFTIQKNTAKARNYLKRVHKMPYNADEGESYERSWLLLADIHIAGGKFDLAQDLCRRCLKYNKSCARAWELMGSIMEREQAYRDAADHYERAFKFEHELSPTVGYKLAFNYLKAKRYVEAIETCKKVLHAFPKYPKIKADILMKAQAAVRA